MENSVTLNLFLVDVHIIKYKRTRWGRHYRFIAHFPASCGYLFAYFIAIGYWEFMFNFQARSIVYKSIQLHINNVDKEIKNLKVPELTLELTKARYTSMSRSGSLSKDGYEMFETRIKELEENVNNG